MNASSDQQSAIDLICSEYPDSEVIGMEKVTIFYDKSFSRTGQNDAAYTLDIALSQEDFMLHAEINMKRQTDGKVIYSLDNSHHLQRRDKS